MTWVFRQDITGPQGARGPRGPSGTPADTSQYYDSLRFTGGNRPILTIGTANVPAPVSAIRGLEEPDTDGTGLWLQVRYLGGGWP